MIVQNNHYIISVGLFFSLLLNDRGELACIIARTAGPVGSGPVDSYKKIESVSSVRIEAEFPCSIQIICCLASAKLDLRQNARRDVAISDIDNERGVSSGNNDGIEQYDRALFASFLQTKVA